MKHLRQSEGGAALHGLYAAVDPRDLDLVTVLPHRSRAIATGAVVGPVEVVEIVAGNEVASVGS